MNRHTAAKTGPCQGRLPQMRWTILEQSFYLRKCTLLSGCLPPLGGESSKRDCSQLHAYHKVTGPKLRDGPARW